MSHNPFGALLSVPGGPAPSTTLATLLPMTFLENLEAQADGSVVFTSQLDGRLWVHQPSGELALLAQVPGRAVSVAGAPDGGGWLVFGSDLQGQVSVFSVSPTGDVETAAVIEGAVFPNGVQRLSTTDYLLVDSVTGILWHYDHAGRTSKPWIQDDLLLPAPGSPWPGANGVKVFGDRLYVSNTAQNVIISVALDGIRPAGSFEVKHQGIGGDDFAFAADGTLFLTTHPFDVVLAVTPDGEVSLVAGPDEGVRGCTACRFGVRPGDESVLYVVTDGGLLNPSSGGLAPARLVGLDVGTTGAPVDRLDP